MEARDDEAPLARIREAATLGAGGSAAVVGLYAFATGRWGSGAASAGLLAAAAHRPPLPRRSLHAPCAWHSCDTAAATPAREGVLEGLNQGLSVPSLARVACRPVVSTTLPIALNCTVALATLAGACVRGGGPAKRVKQRSPFARAKRAIPAWLHAGAAGRWLWAHPPQAAGSLKARAPPLLAAAPPSPAPPCPAHLGPTPAQKTALRPQPPKRAWPRCAVGSVTLGDRLRRGP